MKGECNCGDCYLKEPKTFDLKFIYCNTTDHTCTLKGFAWNNWLFALFCFPSLAFLCAASVTGNAHILPAV